MSSVSEKEAMTVPPKTSTDNMTEQKGHSRAFVLCCLLMNIALSISIVLVNKSVYEFYMFPNMTLTCIHFVCTSIGMVVSQYFGVFTVKKLPISKMVPIALTFCGFVMFTNLSLQFNTVGTYQIIKSLTTPTIIMIQTYFYGRHFSTKVKLTLLPIIVGVWMNCYYDLSFNVIGIIFAGIGVAVTSLYQVWVGEKQKEFGVNSMQLLYYQAPLSALFLALVVPFFEPVFGVGGLFGPWTLGALGMVLLSGVIAFAINVSIFWIIGNTSPLTYNMVGQFKFSFVIITGFILFRDPLIPLQFLGISLTFSGVFAYTWFKLKEQEADKARREMEERLAKNTNMKETAITINNNESAVAKS